MVVAAIAIALVGTAYAFYVWSAFGLASRCGDETKKEVSSPDGAYVAAFFERNCGATTDYASIVTLRRRGDQFNGDKDEAILVIDGLCAIDLAWTGRALAASYANSCSVVSRSGSWHDVAISFHDR
jgi:hypothetical protein